LFFLTDHLAKYLGRLFICLFLLIVSSIVYIFYSSIFVHLYEEIHNDKPNRQHSMWTFIGHAFIAHWLLINIMFNYIQCVRVDPGTSPNFGSDKPYDFDKANRDRMKIYQANIDRNNNKSNEVNVSQIVFH
jgi:hypothetical protein